MAFGHPPNQISVAIWRSDSVYQEDRRTTLEYAYRRVEKNVDTFWVAKFQNVVRKLPGVGFCLLLEESSRWHFPLFAPILNFSPTAARRPEEKEDVFDQLALNQPQPTKQRHGRNYHRLDRTQKIRQTESGVHLGVLAQQRAKHYGH